MAQESFNVRKLIVLKKYQQYLIWLLEKINRFPRKQKYLLGERIGNKAFDILEIIIQIQYTSRDQRRKLIPIFNLKLENLRQLIRIAWKMKFLSHQSFIWQEVKINEVGQMVHGMASSPMNQ